MDKLKAGNKLKKYEIIRPLGKGGMSKVYLAKDKGNNLYAIKEMANFTSSLQKKMAAQIFAKEVDILSSLNHPGLPVFHERFSSRNRMYISMEYIEGDTLEELINSTLEPFEEKNVLLWAIQICEILFYLHSQSPEPVIYRDLKPANIIISKSGMARLVDFGIARYYDPRKDKDTLNLGTPGYAAPEQCKIEGQSTPGVDIYALGVVIHELLTLHEPSFEPFRLPPVSQLNPGVSEELEFIINKATALKPEERYKNTALFREALIDYYKKNRGSSFSSYIDKDDLEIIEFSSLPEKKNSSVIEKYKILIFFTVLFIIIIISYFLVIYK